MLIRRVISKGRVWFFSCFLNSLVETKLNGIQGKTSKGKITDGSSSVGADTSSACGELLDSAGETHMCKGTCETGPSIASSCRAGFEAAWTQPVGEGWGGGRRLRFWKLFVMANFSH